VLGGLKLAVGAGQVFARPLHGVPVVMLGHPYPRNVLRRQRPTSRRGGPSAALVNGRSRAVCGPAESAPIPLFPLERALHLPRALLAGLIVLVLFTIVELDYSFSGGARIGTGAFELVLNRFETSKLSDLR
jgi:hypothetical protein